MALIFNPEKETSLCVCRRAERERERIGERQKKESWREEKERERERVGVKRIREWRKKERELEMEKRGGWEKKDKKGVEENEREGRDTSRKRKQ